jgi:hypothetical protein
MVFSWRDRIATWGERTEVKISIFFEALAEDFVRSTGLKKCKPGISLVELNLSFKPVQVGKEGQMHVDPKTNCFLSFIGNQLGPGAGVAGLRREALP